MSRKRKTITLSGIWGNGGDEMDPYRVEKLSDTTQYVPGDFLPQREVSELCNSDGWKVTIIAKPTRG